MANGGVEMLVVARERNVLLRICLGPEDDQTAPGIRLACGLVTLHCAFIYRPSCRALNSPDSTALSETEYAFAPGLGLAAWVALPPAMLGTENIQPCFKVGRQGQEAPLLDRSK